MTRKTQTSCLPTKMSQVISLKAKQTTTLSSKKNTWLFLNPNQLNPSLSKIKMMEVSLIILAIIPHPLKLMEKGNQNPNRKPKKGLAFRQDQSLKDHQKRSSQRFQEKRQVLDGITITCQNLSSLKKSKTNKLIATQDWEVVVASS